MIVNREFYIVVVIFSIYPLQYFIAGGKFVIHGITALIRLVFYVNFFTYKNKEFIISFGFICAVFCNKGLLITNGGAATYM